MKKEFYLLSPLTYFIVSYFYQIVVTPFVFIQLVPEKADIEAYTQTFCISLVFLVACFMGWKIGLKFGKVRINKALNFLSFNLKDNIKYKDKFLILVFLILYVLCFIVLAVRGGGELFG